MKNNQSKLKKYASKRNFEITPEPALSGKKKTSKRPLFVVQKHAASHLHYDLRLEIEGVLASWAVPKGFTLDPAIKHLAVQTEDHPYEYAHFEGVIPAGEYGGGTVMVWDIGTYENIKKVGNKMVPMATCLKQGHVEILLLGKKLHGGFALVRMARGDGHQWLLIKERDEFAKEGDKRWSQRSALTGRTMAQIKREEA
jgi:bifunctional non-homologous end joining protein LigD